MSNCIAHRDLARADVTTPFLPPCLPAGQPGTDEPTPLDPNDPEANLHVELNDQGNGARFARQHRGEALYVRERARWIVYRDGRWQDDQGDCSAIALARRTALSIRSEPEDDPRNRKLLNDWSMRTLKGSGLENMLKAARTFPWMNIHANELDRSSDLLNLRNGTLELRTDLFRVHNPEDLLTVALPFDYDPHARCPRTLAALRVALAIEGRESPNEAAPSAEERRQREELLDFLQEVVGYSLCGRPDKKVMFFVHGPADSGKSFLFKILERLAGPYHRVVRIDTLTRIARGDNTPELATLPGKRVVLTSEAGHGHKWKDQVIKDLTGTDTITACAKYSAPFTFHPQFVILAFGNVRPTVDSADEAFWSRIIEIPFAHAIPVALQRPEAELVAMIEMELPGLLNWALEGMRRLATHGRFRIPELVRNATMRNRDEADVVRTFVSECCYTRAQVERDEVFVDGRPGRAELVARLGDIYAAYTHWCGKCGEKPVTRARLQADLHNLGYGRSLYRPSNMHFISGVTLMAEVALGDNEYARPSARVEAHSGLSQDVALAPVYSDFRSASEGGR